TLQMQAALKVCREDTDLVVELGSGWGLNVLDIYLSGGPSNAKYRGMELSRSGRECATRLAALEPASDFEALAFNYTQPDYPQLPTSNGHTLVFTSHSIEQIRNLPFSVILGFLDRGTPVTGVHFEPIGWQVRETTGETCTAGATRENSARAGYNENFWSMLQDLKERGRIVIRRAEADYFGHKTKNVSTFIVWDSVPL
ncbi:MAG: hypothetical protein L3J04_04965, partial [Robiginitomaculum sp.]|nr:hypothetical protein [Robiginitomaculum sp.]